MTTEESELLEIVDSNDQVIGQALRGEVYAQGLLHRAVNIIIVNSKGEIYLQQRSAQKKSFPLHWDLSAAEHLKPGENYQQAAIRGLKEELGLDLKVRKIRPVHNQKNIFQKGDQRIIENELVELFQAEYDGEMTIDTAEVADGKFVSKEDISKMVDSGELDFTPWFLDEWSFLQTMTTG